MDFSTEEKTSKTFNPDGSSVRSEVTRENINGSTVSGGIPGSLSNQPPASSQIPETIKNDNNTGTVVSGSSVGNMSKEATRNYELDTVITHKQKGYGGISKLSVSVAVNYLEQTVDGKLQQTPRSDVDFDKIRKLLEGGLGIDATRGDALEVVSVPFNRVQSLDELPEEPIYEQEWFWRGFKILASVILVIVIVLVVIKPMVEKLLADKKKEDHDTGAEDLDDQVALDGDDDLHLIAQSVEGSNGESVYNVKNGQVILPDIHKDEDVLRAVRALVANEPDLAAKVVKEWLEGENTK
jgi:flagellar M-ring protein FliF